MAEPEVAVKIDRRLFERLQALAEPIVDDINSVLARLLDAPPEHAAELPARRRFVSLARGERLPVGLRLVSVFRGTKVEALVTEEGIVFDGTTYHSPSAAATAAKVKLGLPSSSAHANGWLFWDYLDETLGCYSRLYDRRHGGWDEGPARTATGRGSRSPAVRPRSVGSGSSGTRDTSVIAGDLRPEPRSWR